MSSLVEPLGKASGNPQAILAVLLTMIITLVACAPAPTATPTPNLPTPTLTPIPPTSTSNSLIISPANAAKLVQLNSITVHYIGAETGNPSVSWSPDAKMLILTEFWGFHRYLVENLEELPVIEKEGGIPVFSNDISNDGQILASGELGETVEVWDVSTGRHLYTLLHKVQDPDRSGMSVAISPDSRSIATANSNGANARLWDARTGKLIRTFEPEGQQYAVQAVAFSSDGRMLVTVDGFFGFRGIVRVWDAQSGQLLRTFTLPEQEQAELKSGVGHVSLSPDGHILTMASVIDNSVLLWDVDSGQLLHTIKEVPYVAVTFSPDGRTLALGRQGMDPLNPEPNNCTPPQTLDIDAYPPFYIFHSCTGVFSPDGRILATVSSGKTVKLWEVSTGQLIHMVEDSSYVLSIAFSPDGTTIALLRDDNTLQLWGVKP